MKFDFQEGIESAPTKKLLERLDAIDLSTQAFPLVVSIERPEFDLWSFLSSNGASPRMVWYDRDSATMTAGLGCAADCVKPAGLGMVEFITQCRSLLGDNDDLKLFGGLSFDGTDNWSHFGAGRFIIPRFLITEESVTVAIMDEGDVERARTELLDLVDGSESYCEDLAEPTKKSYLPTFDGWQSRVDEALELIRREVIEKIVLSRKTQFEFREKLDPIALTSSLYEQTLESFVFCFQFHEDNAFVGATPERLFYRQGEWFKSEVVAGTRLRGDTPVEDERLAIELLTCDKDQREHEIVRKSIRQKLHKFIDHLDVDTQASILRLARKQHLKSNVAGKLKPGVDDGMLLQRMHPTPAVGGYPTDNALPEINRIEPFNRGWYAAPVGWIGRNSSQFAVAIRSGLVQDKILSVFSGAGIVRGSEPDSEWEEVENKIQDFVGLFKS